MSPDFATPQEILYWREANEPDLPYLHQPTAGAMQVLTWGECIDQARRLVSALLALGLKPGDRVAIFSRNCAHWLIADYALMIGGFVSVPIYSSASEETTRHILQHSGARAVFVGKLDDPQAQDRGIDAALIRIAMPYPTIACQLHWQQLVDSNRPWEPSPVPDPSELMTLLYTSGSTGQPKGAMHSFASFLFAGRQTGAAFEFGPGDRLLSYLPLAHCTERAYVEASTLVHGGQLWFVESIDRFMQAMIDCRPTVFGSVPRLWKVFQLQVLSRVPQRRLDRLLSLPWVSDWIRSRIHRSMGIDQSRWFMSGSAPIAPALLRWWEALDVPIAEGWGMTETFAYGTVMPYGEATRRGSIGKASPATQLRVSAAGELEIKTPTLLQGYYKELAKTAEAMTEDGFFMTGDRARIDADGYVTITGRVKDIFKTAKGKYVAPVPIESLLARNAHIEQVCVVGSGLTQPIALVRLTESAASLDAERVTASLEQTRIKVNGDLEKHEAINHLLVVSDPWEVANDLLTPTLKIRRHAIEKRYRSLIEAHYNKSVYFTNRETTNGSPDHD